MGLAKPHFPVGSYEDPTETLVSVLVFDMAGGHKKTIHLDNTFLCGTVVANIQTGEAPYLYALVFDEGSGVGTVKVFSWSLGQANGWQTNTTDKELDPKSIRWNSPYFGLRPCAEVGPRGSFF
ncbi:MAG: hypothetical protein O3B01_11595 [Planctomycetota bacterium]|nr:hypothetical protein [Planctomycetota bacterium]MDA1139218.1 hypothetical protein [Planctomycetota bacterium]